MKCMILCIMTEIKTKYLSALGLLNLSEVSRETGRAYRTLQAYRRGELEPSPKAVLELIGYLRAKGETLKNAAEELAAHQEEEPDG